MLGHSIHISDSLDIFHFYLYLPTNSSDIVMMSHSEQIFQIFWYFRYFCHDVCGGVIGWLAPDK